MTFFTNGLTLRGIKKSALTHAELDNNFVTLDSGLSNLQNQVNSMSGETNLIYYTENYNDHSATIDTIGKVSVLAGADVEIVNDDGTGPTQTISLGGQFPSTEIRLSTTNSNNNLNNSIILSSSDFSPLNGININSDNFIKINNLYNLPQTDGTAGQVLTTDGAGQTSWSVPSVGFPLYYFASNAPGDPALARMITSNTCYIQVTEDPKVEMVTPNGAIYLDYTQLGLKTDLPINIGTNSFNTISIDNQNLGFYDTAPITKPTVISGDVNSLITALQQLGLINVV